MPPAAVVKPGHLNPSVSMLLSVTVSPIVTNSQLQDEGPFQGFSSFLCVSFTAVSQDVGEVQGSICAGSGKPGYAFIAHCLLWDNSQALFLLLSMPLYKVIWKVCYPL